MKLAAIIPSSILFTLAAVPAWGQTAWDPNAVPFEGPSSWQQAAVAALNRHLPTDSGFFVLGPIDPAADRPDTTRLVESTLRILAPDPRSSRRIIRRLRLPTGGVALEEIAPADTLPHELPPGYPGRFLDGRLVGAPVYVQVMTVQEHRWMLWARRAQLIGVTVRVGGPLAGYSKAVTRYLAAIDSGKLDPQAPVATRFGLDPSFDLYADPPPPVIRGSDGYLRLLDRNRAFRLDGAVAGVSGFIPGPRLAERLKGGAEGVLFYNKEGEVALQHRYREFRGAAGRWSGKPVLSQATLRRLWPGRYIYIVDRYGFMRVAAAGAMSDGGLSAALLNHGDPARVAGTLILARGPTGELEVRELDINSGAYFFSNLSLTIYADVEERSDRYMRAVGHALRALDDARIPRKNILLRKF